jgi:hypothetical protein
MRSTSKISAMSSSRSEGMMNNPGSKKTVTRNLNSLLKTLNSRSCRKLRTMAISSKRNTCLEATCTKSGRSSTRKIKMRRTMAKLMTKKRAQVQVRIAMERMTRKRKARRSK